MYHTLAVCWLQQQNMSFGSAFVGFPAGCWWGCSGNHCGGAQEATSPAHQLPHPQRHPECCCSRGGRAQAVLPHGDIHTPSAQPQLHWSDLLPASLYEVWLVVRRLVRRATCRSLVHHSSVVLLRHSLLHLVNGLHQMQLGITCQCMMLTSPAVFMCTAAH